MAREDEVIKERLKKIKEMKEKENVMLSLVSPPLCEHWMEKQNVVQSEVQ